MNMYKHILLLLGTHYNIWIYIFIHGWDINYIHLSPALAAVPQLHRDFLWPPGMSAQMHPHTSTTNHSQGKFSVRFCIQIHKYVFLRLQWSEVHLCRTKYSFITLFLIFKINCLNVLFGFPRSILIYSMINEIINLKLEVFYSLYPVCTRKNLVF